MTKRDKKVLRLFVFYWLPVLIWSGAVFYFSHQPGLEVGLFTPSALETLTRKVLHVIEFGGLALLAWRALAQTTKWSYGKNGVISFIITATIAGLDEIHQLFVAGRSGQAIDVIVDVLAIFIVLQILYFLAVKKSGRFFLVAVIFSLAMLAFTIGWMMIESEEIHNTNENHREKAKQLYRELKKSREEKKSLRQKEKEIEKKTEIQDSLLSPDESTPDEKKEVDSKTEPFLNQMKISVPFTSQAPFALWDDVHEEACEEASLMMVKFFLDGKHEDVIPKDVAEDEIQKLKVFQEENYGTYKDSNMQELTKIAKEFYGIENLNVIYDFEKDEIKKQLDKGNPIIVPTAGRELGNPNFTPPGPLYHNLVLIGYEGDEIITNDPGTRRGKDYRYDIEILYNAIHDFPGNKEEILTGRKAMIVVRRED